MTSTLASIVADAYDILYADPDDDGWEPDECRCCCCTGECSDSYWDGPESQIDAAWNDRAWDRWEQAVIDQVTVAYAAMPDVTDACLTVAYGQTTCDCAPGEARCAWTGAASA